MAPSPELFLIHSDHAANPAKIGGVVIRSELVLFRFGGGVGQRGDVRHV
ncbi:hypothetical protein [Neorhodopirellula pilleata]|uniref:Uncharacterized protein n=1 Tax=Neorhodopirellula pilleata TaxID=2714738 RepID=A0A5C6AQV2_9BACT|nr:hypothetical protein [Neorhodopirellula pilleata]TWU01867.1 hypothetical protein Pla100_16030 [Neorhodopirellula pilleata]